MNWDKIWKKFGEWYDANCEADWTDQMKWIEELVEEELKTRTA